MRSTVIALTLGLCSAGIVWAVPNDRCCVNPQTGAPSNPVGASCNWSATAETKCSNGGSCSGEGWQVASPGFCGFEEEAGCSSGAQTLVTLRFGTYQCQGATQQNCGCNWVQANPAVTDNIQIGTCVGNACS